MEIIMDKNLENWQAGRSSKEWQGHI